MQLRSSLTPALLGVLIVGLSACGRGEDPGAFADLRGEPTPEASVPSSVHEDDLDLMDLETIRWIGEHDGSRLWLSSGQSPREVCLLVYTSESEAMVACGADRDALVVNGGEYTVVPDGVSPPADSTALSENVFVGS